ncbi:MAG: DEAD/DEAH box helicase [Candidatus Cloacimonetes bacterium]|nr:DEAD/DEAH box helicase [Candidatus Cloacimonadota bacterium]
MIKISDLSLPEPILRAAAELGYTTATPIQALCIPILLEQEPDLIALAHTGTGKTAAFGFPLLSALDSEAPFVQSLILCPTRELCVQITQDLQDYARFMPQAKIVAVYGGAPIFRQEQALKAGANIVVGTPGRVKDMIQRKALNLQNLRRLILDEADEMLNMGFKDEIFEIIAEIPEKHQTLLFSATMPPEVEKLAQSIMNQPLRLSAGDEKRGVDGIQHFFYKVQPKNKYFALKRIVDMNPKIYCIIFCRTRSETQQVADQLQKDGYNVEALHGDLSQAQRELVMNRFRSKYIQLLVATDVAARGLDVDDLTHIINYHVPLDPDIYIHRSGRTGRAGKTGVSLTIMHSKEATQMKAVEKRLGREIIWKRIPGGREICERQLYHFIDGVERVEVNENEIAPFLENVYKKLSWMSREELIRRFVSVEFNRFLNYYKDLPDLESPEDKPKRSSAKGMKYTPFKLQLGSSSGLNKKELLRFVNQLAPVCDLNIGNIRIFNEFSIIELESGKENEILSAFESAKYRGIAPQATLDKKGKTAFAGKAASGGKKAKKQEYKAAYSAKNTRAAEKAKIQEIKAKIRKRTQNK